VTTRRQIQRAAVAFAVLASGWAAPGRAQANDAVDRCLRAHERGQAAEQKSELGEALRQFEECRASRCPSVVQKDCSRRFASVESDRPSLLVRAQRGGRLLAEATLAIDDGEASALGEDPTRIDPGSHRIVIESADGARVERRLVLSRGERRELDVELPAPGAASSAPEPATPKGASPSPWPYVFGSVAVVGLAGFVGFGLSGKSRQSKLDECKPSCNDPNLYDDMKRSYLFADVSLAIGLAAGVATWLTLPRSDAAPPAATRGPFISFGGQF